MIKNWIVDRSTARDFTVNVMLFVSFQINVFYVIYSGTRLIQEHVNEHVIQTNADLYLQWHTYPKTFFYQIPTLPHQHHQQLLQPKPNRNVQQMIPNMYWWKADVPTSKKHGLHMTKQLTIVKKRWKTMEEEYCMSRPLYICIIYRDRDIVK